MRYLLGIADLLEQLHLPRLGRLPRQAPCDELVQDNPQGEHVILRGEGVALRRAPARLQEESRVLGADVRERPEEVARVGEGDVVLALAQSEVEEDGHTLQ